jgi:hypothetical protein
MTINNNNPACSIEHIYNHIIAAGSSNGEISFWDIADGSLKIKLTTHSDIVKTIKIS